MNNETLDLFICWIQYESIHSSTNVENHDLEQFKPRYWRWGHGVPTNGVTLGYDSHYPVVSGRCFLGLGASWHLHFQQKNPGAKATNWVSHSFPTTWYCGILWNTVEYCGWKNPCTTVGFRNRVVDQTDEAKCSETFSGGPHQGQPLETLIEVTGLSNLSWEFRFFSHSYV